MDHGGSYDRKLENVLLARLRAGHEPERLLAELKTRLPDADADTVLSRAEGRFHAAARQAPGPLAPRVLIGIAYAWTVVLVLQNLMIVASLASTISATPGIYPAAFLVPFLSVTLAKVGALCAGVFAFKRWRSAYTAALYALAVLCAFPLGLYATALFVPDGPAPEGEAFLSVSALCSYATVALIGVAYWLGRRSETEAVQPDVFD